MDYTYNPWNSPGQNTGVGSLSLLQGIFPTQGSNPGLPHCRQIILPTEPQFSSVQSLSCVQLFATPWAAAYQATPSMGFSRQEYWSGVPLPSLHQPLHTSIPSFHAPLSSPVTEVSLSPYNHLCTSKFYHSLRLVSNASSPIKFSLGPEVIASGPELCLS